MAAKVDSSSSVEPRRGQSAVSVSSSSAISGSSPKVSMFGAKSGFVIPKNKLSGSLVPIFRGGSKVDAGISVKEESSKQIQRKTKWGADLTQDAAVRKGRLLAYQTRVEQINEQLKSGTLEIGNDQDSQTAKEDSNHQFVADHADKEAQKSELLKLERREIIGEILRLNPSYKAPPDYKPLLKEGSVPIPVKAYPGYNFIGLLLGPESNTQKRLEEETGAKIQVYGTKANTKEKHEITHSDKIEAQGAYEELYVKISADTYEKVDIAVALIELLVTPVSGNAVVTSKDSALVTGDNANIYDQSQKDSASGYMIMPMADVNQGVPQPMLVPTQHGQLQFHHPYPSPWFPVAPPNALPRLPTGFMPLHFPNNPVRLPPSSIGPPNMPPYFGQPPPFGSVPRPLSPAITRLQLPMHATQQPPPNQGIPPQNQSMPGQHLPHAYPVMSAQPTSTAHAFYPASQPMLSGNNPATRQPVPMNPQPGSMARPLTAPAPPGNSSGWSTAPSSIPPPQRPNTTHMAPQTLNSPIRPQQASLTSPQNSMNNNTMRSPFGNFTPPGTFPLRPSNMSPSFSSVPPQIRPVSAPAAVPSSPLQAPMPPSSIPPTVSQAPRPPHVAVAPPAPMPQPPISQTVPLHNAASLAPTQAITSSQPVAPVMSQPAVTVPSVAPRPAQQPVQLPRPSPPGPGSTNMTSFSPINPPRTGPLSAPAVTAPKPLRPSSGDFTFQPLRTQVPASPTAPSPNSTSVQNSSSAPLTVPQVPSFRPALQSPASLSSSPGFPQPLSVNQMDLPQASVRPSPPPAPFPTNPATVRPQQRFPFSNSNPVLPVPPSTQMHPPSFSPAPQMPSLPSRMPARPTNVHQNQSTPANRPSGLMLPNQQLGSNPGGYASSKVSSTPGGNQIYDPFSPTSISPAPQQGGGQLNGRKPEADAEYEDLMASVGVK